MAVTFNSIEGKSHGEEWDMPQSPGAGYGLMDDFDPAKYDFYNPITRGPVSGTVAEQNSLGSKHHGEERRPMEDNDEGSPEQLSPIEELDDDIRFLHPPQQSTQSKPPSILADKSPRSALKKTVDSGLAGLEERTRGLLPLERRIDLLFSRQHLQAILADHTLALKFITFLRTHRPSSVSILTYYLGACNALKALRHAKSIIDSLEAVPGHSFTNEISSATIAWVVEDKIGRTLDVLVQEDVPAFIAYVYAETIELALVRQMNGRQDATSAALPNGLAEAFILSDPATPDNPINFSSEGFHSLTGYCREEVLGRNCLVLSGNNTNPYGRKRFKSALDAEREHCEVLLNYRQDGSPSVNMIMSIPLRDKSNRVRYYLGAQLDITELVNDYTGFDSLRQVVEHEEHHSKSILSSDVTGDGSADEDFAGLVNVFTTQEFEKLAALKRHEPIGAVSSSPKHEKSFESSSPTLPDPASGGITPALGFYQNYLLARPHPSLRVLFASPRLQSSGILQQPLLDNIGGSSRVRQDLARAIEMGRKVTAKVQWLPRSSNPTNCWLHCTPLVGINNTIGVWIIILVDAHSDDDISQDTTRSPYLRTGTLEGERYATDPTPWDRGRKHKFPSQASTAIRTKDDDNVRDAKGVLQAAPNGAQGVSTENDQDPLMLKARLDLPDQAGGQVSNKILEDNHAANENKLPTIGQNPRYESTTQQTFRHDIDSGGKSGRPRSTGSHKVPFQSTLQPAVKVDARSSVERRAGKPAPINMPGLPPSSSENDDNKGLFPARKRTYKSLSPYGIIFDD